MSQDSFRFVKFKNGVYTLNTSNRFSFHLWRKPTTTLHEHENYIEIFIVQKGRIVNKMNGGAQHLDPGDAGVILPGTPHIHYTANAQETSEIINITCEMETAKKLLGDIGAKRFSDLQSGIFSLTGSQFKTAKRFTDDLLKNPENEDFIIPSFFLYVTGAYLSRETEKNKLPELLDSFVEQLKNIDYKTTKVRDLYRLSGYSQSSLSVKFKQHFGVSIVQYLNGEKMKYACNLLRKTDMSILDISNELGFDNLSHFYHLFKKTYGVTPMQFKTQEEGAKQIF